MTRAYDIVTFDCYGTLIDWESGIRRAFAEEAALAGVSVAGDAVIEEHARLEPKVEATYKSYREVLAEVAGQITRYLGLRLPADRANFLGDSVASWTPFPDTNAALERLVAAGFRLGILSNIDDDLLAATRRHFTVDFDLIVTAAQVRSYKPAPRHFTTARAKIPTTDRWLHAAQSYFHDIVPARALGIPNAWVNRKHERSLDGSAPDLEVPTLAALADALGCP